MHMQGQGKGGASKTMVYMGRARLQIPASLWVGEREEYKKPCPMWVGPNRDPESTPYMGIYRRGNVILQLLL